MSRLLKILVATTVIIIILLFAGYFALKSFLTPKYMQAIVQKIASEVVQRPVEIGRVGLKIGFGVGITIDDISVPNSQGFSPGPMIEVRKTTLNIRLLPLLRRQVAISSINLEQMIVNLERNKGKELNFTGLMPREVKGTGWDFTLSELNIRDSELRYSDAITRSEYVARDINQRVQFHRNKIAVAGKLNAIVPKSRELPELQLALHNDINYDTLTKNIDVRKINIRGKPMQLSISGTVEKCQVLDLEGKLRIDDMSRLKNLIPKENRPEELRGAAEADFTLGGTTKDPRIDGHCAITGANVMPKGMARAIEKINGNFTFNLSAIRDMVLEGHIGTTEFSVEGGVSDLGKKPLLNISAEMEGELKDFQGLTNSLEHIDLAGTIISDITVKGKIDDLRYFGDIKIASAYINGIGLGKPVSDLDLKGTFEGGTLRVGSCKGKIGRSDFSFSGQLSNFTKPVIQINNRSNYIDLDELLPKASGQTPKGKAPPIMLKGMVNIRRLTGMDMEFKNISTKFEYKKGIVDIRNCQAETFDGQAYMDFYYNANSPEPYRINTRMRSVSAQKILQRFLRFDRLKGEMSGQGDFQGKGLDQSSVKSNLNATGNLLVHEGEFNNFTFLTKLLAWLGLKDYKNVPFNNLRCSFKIHNGRGEVQDWTFSARVGDFLTDGSISLNGNVDLHVAATLSKQHSNTVRKYHGDWIFFEDKQGRTVVDIIVSGRLHSPTFKLDKNRIKERIGGRLKDEFEQKKKDFEEQLKDLLKW
jgi:uncharacterized protein involved in outer membrane biogenesis